MTDIVHIGFSINTSQIEKGYQRLNKMGDAAEKAEKKTKKMEGGLSGLQNKLKKSKASVDDLRNSISNMAFLVGGTAATAVVLFMNHLANLEKQTQASARMAGLTTDQFDAMSFAYRQFGLTVEQVNDIYKDSRERVGEWLSTQSGALQDFGDVMGMSKDEITAFALEVNNLTGQQLLQRMVNDMEAAGASANEMSFALEGMASEATRMIPALENGGKAVSDLSSEYIKFNAAFSLDEGEAQKYADLAKNFDLFLDTAQNGVTKVLSPLAEVMSVLAMEATEFLASIASGSIAAAQKEYSAALEEQLKARTMLAELKKKEGVLIATGTYDSEMKIANERLEAANVEVAAADKRLEAAKKTAQAQLEVNRNSTRNININASGGISSSSSAKTPAEETKDQSTEYEKWIQSINNSYPTLDELQGKIAEIALAMMAGDIAWESGQRAIADIEERIKSLGKTLGEAKDDSGNGNFLGDAFSGINEGILAFREFGEAGTKEYERLTRAAQAFAAAQAIATGNIFGAIGIAGSVVSSLKSRGLEDDSAKNQQQQFLDAFGNKQDSIATATEMTASASDKLVGINTKMLDALTNLRSSILGAAGIVTQETRANQISTPTFVTGNIFEDVFGGGLIGGLLGGWADKLTGGLIGGLLGGKQKVTDDGIKIIGGSITDLIEDVTVGAFQTVKYKKWALGKSKSKELFSDLGNDVSNQFSLVFADILTGVVAGAETLGLSQSEIDKAVNSFNIATQKISLRGLSAEQQQKEINAYFSSVLNDLTGAVVPFIGDFQKAGEELGETLARLATEVSIFELVGSQLGVVIGDKLADPQAFAEAANNLSELAGGVEQFAEKTSQFIDAFAPENVKLGIYADSLDKMLGEVGLTLPDTADGFWQLMQSLDATTEAGREQIAILLNATGQADAYYSILDRITDKYRDAATAMYDMDEATRRISIDSALAAARMGDFSLAEGLNLSGIAPSMGDFSSAFEYNLARAETAAKLNELADLQSGQVTVQDKQLSVLEDIRDKIGGSESGVESEIKSLKDQMYKLQTTTNDLLERMTYQLA